MKYEIVEAESASELVKAVNSRLETGWAPLGQPFFQKYRIVRSRGFIPDTESGTTWFQALVKEEL